MPVQPRTPDGSPADPPEPDAEAAAPEPEDEVKARFRAALERKRGAQNEAANGRGGAGRSKVRGEHGPAAGQRSFRRKSGG